MADDHHYRQYSYWLETAGDDLTPRPPLDGSVDVDVAILGAGFTGLWTAYALLEREPSLTVALVEAEIAGFGASGRNGGWCYSGFPIGPGELLQTYGRETARAVTQAMYGAVDDVGRVCAAEGIDAHYEKAGSLDIARAAYDLPKLQELWDAFRALGLEKHYALLDRDETDARVRVAGAAGSFLNRQGATVQPARLARGLARAVERRDATIYERTRVLDYRTGDRPALLTGRGEVRAKTIVLAGEAYLSRLKKHRRAIIPMTSHIVLTEPLDADRWAEIGWQPRSLVGGLGTQGGYLNHTADGRIAFGAYRPVYPYHSKITDALDRNETIFAHARECALAWFPMLRGVRFTHAWGGVFGVPRDHMPVMRYDGRDGVAIAGGYTGEGVATSNLSGRVLADLITGRVTDLTRLPMASHRSPSWEPEPLRSLGVRLVIASRQRYLRQVERDGAYPARRTLMQRFWDS